MFRNVVCIHIIDVARTAVSWSDFDQNLVIEGHRYWTIGLNSCYTRASRSAFQAPYRG